MCVCVRVRVCVVVCVLTACEGEGLGTVRGCVGSVGLRGGSLLGESSLFSVSLRSSEFTIKGPWNCLYFMLYLLHNIKAPDEVTFAHI